MRIDTNDIKYILVPEQGIKAMINNRPFEIFSEESISFLHNLHSVLIKDPRSSVFPDVVSLAFFCRKASINKLKQQLKQDSEIRVGRGLALHISPANVPVNFAYSLIAGILSGNSNIVRIPSKNYEQVQIICDGIDSTLRRKEFHDIRNRIAIIQYDKHSEATATLSQISDIRVIWGGDITVGIVRKESTPPRTIDITFPDRYSFCVIDAEAYLKAENKTEIANGFYNDTYLSDQNACTAPHLIVWIGKTDKANEAQQLFWEALSSVLINKKFILQPLIAVDKLTQFYLEAIALPGIRNKKTGSNNIWLIENPTISQGIEKYRSASGYFNQTVLPSLDDIFPFVNNKYQTMAYFGFSKEELKHSIRSNRPNGIDRVVPIGKTLDFSLVWDGVDLIKSMSRIIEII